MIKLIKNVKVFRDGEWKDTEILIAGTSIEKVADKIDVSYSGMEVIDGQGMKAIPGLIDQHVHVTGGGGEGSFVTQVPGLSLSAPVKAGVTTIVGVLGTDGITRSVENLVAKTKALNEFGITAYCLTGSYQYPSPTLTGSVLRDITFINEIIGVKTCISDHRASYMSMEEFRRVAADARVAGLMAGKVGEVHIHMGLDPRGLSPVFEVLDNSQIPVSTFRPTHCEKCMDDAIKFMNMGGYADFTAKDHIMDETLEKLSRIYAEAPKGHATLSTDGNGSMPIWNDKNEMIGIGAGKITALFNVIRGLYQKKDIPLEEALKLATENPAKALKLFPRKGQLADGADADIVFLDEDLNIDTVFAMGKLMLKGGKMQVPVNFEAAE